LEEAAFRGYPIAGISGFFRPDGINEKGVTISNFSISQFADSDYAKMEFNSRKRDWDYSFKQTHKGRGRINEWSEYERNWVLDDEVMQLFALIYRDVFYIKCEIRAVQDPQQDAERTIEELQERITTIWKVFRKNYENVINQRYR